MAEVFFNKDLDKITEREVVPDFVSRLSIGKDLTNPDDENKVIIPVGTKLKDGVLMNMIRTFNISDIEHLDSIKTTYTKVSAGETSISIPMPTDNDDNIHTGYLLYRVVQERTGQDVSECFKYNVYEDEAGHVYYKFDLDVPTTHDDIYKAYFYYTDDMPM